MTPDEFCLWHGDLSSMIREPVNVESFTWVMHRFPNRGPLTYYHHRGSKSGDTVLVGATDPRAREARTIDNFVKDHDSEKLSSKRISEG